MRLSHSEKGFTVLELLVVVGIVGVLMAVAFSALSGSTDSARTTRCLANLHSLSTGVQGYGMSSNRGAALAGSIEYEEGGGYCEIPGWVSWYSKNAYAGDSSSHKSSASWFVSTYMENEEARTYCLTNGSIWKAVGANRSVYTCPSHVELARRKKMVPTWSYVMNSEFGWDTSIGTEARQSFGGKNFLKLKKKDRMLLFAELPFNFNNTKQTCTFNKSAGIHLDPTLQYGKNECIGFNHQQGKTWYAHVCFADGHIEKLELPANASQSDIRHLTEWLCESKDVGFDGKNYNNLNENNED